MLDKDQRSGASMKLLRDEHDARPAQTNRDFIAVGIDVMDLLPAPRAPIDDQIIAAGSIAITVKWIPGRISQRVGSAAAHAKNPEIFPFLKRRNRHKRDRMAGVVVRSTGELHFSMLDRIDALCKAENIPQQTTAASRRRRYSSHDI